MFGSFHFRATNLKHKSYISSGKEKGANRKLGGPSYPVVHAAGGTGASLDANKMIERPN